MNTNDCTVYLVDDDPMVRSALKRLLASQGYNVEAYGSAEELLEHHSADRIGVVLSDLAMPGMDGLGLQRALESRGVRRPVIFISGRATVASSVDAMRHGAVDFLTKPVAEADLVHAVWNAVCRDRLERERARLMDETRRRFASLTRRERQVMEQVVQGRLNKQIAGDLDVVEKTVKVHRARVMEKMGVTSVAKLARLYERVGWDWHPDAPLPLPAAADDLHASGRAH